jgi:ribosomal protein S21
MAKNKTKQQKILSQLRQLKKKVEEEKGFDEIKTVTVEEKPASASEKSRFSFKIPVSDNQTNLNASAYDYSHVYFDLRRIAFYASLAIALEIMLSLIISLGHDQTILKFLKLA